jgi:hypothetical protein
MAFGAFAPLPLRLGGDATTGLTPEQHARICADLVALKRVQPLATWLYTQTASNAASISYYLGQNGSGLAYAPTATPNASGDVSFTWSPGVFEDPYGQQWPIRIRAALAYPQYGASLNIASSSPQIIANGVRVYSLSQSGIQRNGATIVKVW